MYPLKIWRRDLANLANRDVDDSPARARRRIPAPRVPAAKAVPLLSVDAYTGRRVRSNERTNKGDVSVVAVRVTFFEKQNKERAFVAFV